MSLSKRNLIDASLCGKGKNCVECSMLRDTGQLLDECVSSIAISALEQYEEFLRLHDGIKNLIKKLNEEVVKHEQSCINGAANQRP